jgi:hypothetical protein
MITTLSRSVSRVPSANTVQQRLDEQEHQLGGNKEEQIWAFRTLLKAMYNQPIIISSANHLELCTEMADYYRCIPCLSVALDGSFLRSPKLTSSLQETCVQLLPVATKLQNKYLFKECLIHVVGPWDSPRSQYLDDPVLIQIAQKTRDEILLKITACRIEIFNQLVSKVNPTIQAQSTNFANPASEASWRDHGSNKVILPQYFRAVYENAVDALPDSLETYLSGLLKNNLIFDRSGFQSGDIRGCYAACFLCADISDEHLPWSIKNVDKQ